MPVELLHPAVLVIVDAAHAVHAVFLLVERSAAFALVLVLVDSEGSWRELFLAMGKAALLLISAEARLNPVLAHLSFVFLLLIISLELGRSRRRSLCLVLLGLLGCFLRFGRRWFWCGGSGLLHYGLAWIEGFLTEGRLSLRRLEEGLLGRAIK